MFVFRDATAGETYPACRFLFGEDPTGQPDHAHFNRAISPPCAFTDFASARCRRPAISCPSGSRLASSPPDQGVGQRGLQPLFRSQMWGRPPTILTPASRHRQSGRPAPRPRAADDIAQRHPEGCPATPAIGASDPAQSPAGNRNMFATECSSPRVTKPATGQDTPRSCPSPSAPRSSARPQGRPAHCTAPPAQRPPAAAAPPLPSPPCAATAPIGPSSRPDRPKARASPTAPIRLPSQTIPQFRSSAPQRDPPVHRRHHHQRIAGEKLRPAHHHQDQPQGKDHAAQHPLRPETGVRPHHRHAPEGRAKADEGPCQHRQRRHPVQRQGGLRHPRRLDQRGNLGGLVGVMIPGHPRPPLCPQHSPLRPRQSEKARPAKRAFQCFPNS
jgi:hypothetical protein